MKTPYLQIQGLKKSYTLKPILRGIDLDLYRGERVALLGANGTGKTTLLRILAGLTKPSAGIICNGGLDIVHDAQRVRHLVGFVAHQPYLYDELTAMENLLFFGRMYAVKQVHERAAELLNRCSVSHWLAPCCIRPNCSYLTSRIQVWMKRETNYWQIYCTSTLKRTAQPCSQPTTSNML